MYKSGYTVNIYKILERDVVDFLNYISLEYYSSEEWKKIYSPRLAELFTRIGNQADIFLRNLCVDAGFYPQSECEDLSFGNYQILNKSYKLDKKEIILIGSDCTLKPFNDFSKSPPNWWIFYNNVKHNGFYHKEEGNLFNVLESLSGLFMLNCIHKETGEILLEEQIRKKGIRNLNLKGEILGNIRSELFEFKRP